MNYPHVHDTCVSHQFAIVAPLGIYVIEQAL